MALRIAISLGDRTGIGPEVTLKALAADLDSDDTRYLLVGDAANVQQLNHTLALNLELKNENQGHATPGRISVYSPQGRSLPPDLEAGSPAAAHEAVACLQDAAQRALCREVDALVTAPVNKQSIVQSGIPFVGQTEFLSRLAGIDRTAMMLLGQDDRGRWLRVVLATTHLPLKRVAQSLTREKIKLAVELGSAACRALGLSRARIGVCGLNPHAGEGGEMGDEEQTIIRPALEELRDQFDINGPFSADTLFYYAFRGDYDVVVAMYHDQGLAPLKMVAFEQGVNWTLGLPFIRTSPDHGTAYDIAGQGKANPSSMLAAIRLAKRLARNTP